MDSVTRFILKLYIFKIASQTQMEQDVSKISETAVDILIDAVLYRISKMAKEIKLFAEQNGRASANGLDVFHVLKRYREDYNTFYYFILETASYDLEMPLKYPIPPKNIKYYDREVSETYPFRVEAPMLLNISEDFTPLPHIPPYFPQPFQADPLITPQTVTNLEKAKRSPQTNNIIHEEMKKNQIIVRPAQTRVSIDSSLSEDIVSTFLNTQSYFLFL